MKGKVAEVRELLAAGDHVGALRLASRFPTLGEHRERIARGWAAQQHPETYRDMGYDPDALIADAIEAIRERLKIEA